jgi:hypothetical protein
VKPEEQLQLNLTAFKIEPKKQEDVARRKEMKEEESGIRKWKLKHRQC